MPDLVPTDPAPIGRPKRVRPDRTYVTRGVIRAMLYIVMVYGVFVLLHALIVQTIGHMNLDMAAGFIWGAGFILGLWTLANWMEREKHLPPS